MSYMASPFLLTIAEDSGLPSLPLLQPLVQPAWKGGDTAVELQTQQLGSNLFGRQSGARAKRVDVDWIVAHVGEQARVRRRRDVFGRRGVPAGAESAELGEHVLGRLDELGTRLDERVAPLGERRVNRTGHREHLAALIGRGSRGDERAGGERRLDDEAAARKAADEPVATRKVRPGGCSAQR